MARRRHFHEESAEVGAGYLYTFPALGTGRADEARFRQLGLAWLDTFGADMPQALRTELHEHLFRTDSMGLSLCFDGPLRETLLAEIWAWLQRQPTDVQEALTPPLRALEAAGSHTHSREWNVVPSIVRTPISSAFPDEQAEERPVTPSRRKGHTQPETLPLFDQRLEGDTHV